MAFTFKKQHISGVILIEPQVFADERGFFMETFKSSEFKNAGLDISIVQINHSRSSRGVLRGLHYQLDPHAQGKLVRCIWGQIYDVAVDLRKGSPTYGKWAGEYLSSDDKKMLYIPEGFAHGFCVVSDAAEIVYYCTGEYNAQSDRSIRFNDQQIGIEWPVQDPVMSDKDKHAPLFKDAEVNFVYKG